MADKHITKRPDSWLNGIQTPTRKKITSYTGGVSYSAHPSEEEQQTRQNAINAMHHELAREFKATTASDQILLKLLKDNLSALAEYQEQLQLTLEKLISNANSHTLKSIALIEKAIDRRERRVLSVIQTLKSAKQPPITVKVFGNAAIAQNQQFNNHAPKDQQKSVSSY